MKNGLWKHMSQSLGGRCDPSQDAAHTLALCRAELAFGVLAPRLSMVLSLMR